jgi:hypothetical protein
VTEAPAREVAVRTLLPLVRKLARRLKRLVPGLDFDDLVGDGCVGLIRAVDSFDPLRGPQLAEYARRLVAWIRSPSERVESFATGRTSVTRLRPPGATYRPRRRWKRGVQDIAARWPPRIEGSPYRWTLRCRKGNRCVRLERGSGAHRRAPFRTRGGGGAPARITAAPA